MKQNFNLFLALQRIPTVGFGRFFALLLLLTVGCRDSGVNISPGNNNHNKPPTSQTTLGVMQVTISGMGHGDMKAKATTPAPVPSSIAQPGDYGGTAGGGIQLKALSQGSFTYGQRGNGGFRYLYATFKVRNADVNGNPYPDPRHNLTFLAIDTDPLANDPETYAHTAISDLSLFNGTKLQGHAADSIAVHTIPTGQVGLSVASKLISTSPDVLQIYSETAIAGIPVPTGVSAFPYGFVVRNPNTPNSRTLPANSDSTQYDGVVTFAFKIPLQVSASQDPFEIQAMFLPIDDSQTRLTQSPQEQTLAGRKALAKRIATLQPDWVTVLPGSEYQSSVTRFHAVPVRIAGPKSNPVTTLFPALKITGASPDSGHAHDQVSITGTYFSVHKADDTVLFNGTPATVDSAFTTRLVVTVPIGATTGPMTVQVSGLAVTVLSFTVQKAFAGGSGTQAGP